MQCEPCSALGRICLIDSKKDAIEKHEHTDRHIAAVKDAAVKDASLAAWFGRDAVAQQHAKQVQQARDKNDPGTSRQMAVLFNQVAMAACMHAYACGSI